MQNNSQIPTITIRHATSNDISQAFDLEEKIYGRLVGINSPPHLLQERLSLFPEGFNVAVNNGVVGVIRALRWNKPELSGLPNVFDFSSLHIPDGRNLYIYDLFVSPEYRKKGVGTSLIQSIVEYANSKDIDKIQLISERNYKFFYEKRGFKFRKEVYEFFFCRLPYMEMPLR